MLHLPGVRGVADGCGHVNAAFHKLGCEFEPARTHRADQHIDLAVDFCRAISKYIAVIDASDSG